MTALSAPLERRLRRAACGTLVVSSVAMRIARTLHVLNRHESGVTEELRQLGREDERVGHYLACWTVGHYAAVTQDDHAVRELGSKLNVVSGEHDGAALVSQVAKQADQPLLLQVIE